jgi:hypothetical protein
MRERLRHWWLAAGVAAAAAGAFVLFRFDPSLNAFYPRCPTYVLLAIYCPGCGALRAAHELLHGDVIAAMGYNVLAVLALPLALYWTVGAGRAAFRGERFVFPPMSGRLSYTVAGLVFGFAILRNIPVSPFTAIAP